MRILVVHSRYSSGALSGENRVVEDETAFLRRWGHEVELISPAADELSRPELLGRSIGSVGIAKEVGRRVRSEGVDVVHVHNLFPTVGPWVLSAAADAGAAVVMTLHNYRLLCLAGTLFRNGEVCEACVGLIPWRGAVYGCYRGSRPQSAVLASAITAARRRGGFSAVHRYLAISEFVRRKHVEAGLPASRILVKPNFVRSPGRREGPGSHYLVLGRLSPEKGVADVVRAWSPDLGELRIAGDGPERADLERLARGRGIRFEGPVSPEAAAELVLGARAVLVPSRWLEPQGRVVLEAYAAGVPVVASRVGGLRELVRENETGFTAAARDVEAWRAALRELAHDDVSVRLGRHAHELWREQFSPERGRVLLDEAYREAIAARELEATAASTG
jgi:glycosyltransferase involved in cell wall biosynthesis